jgi:hypothetical protein
VLFALFTDKRQRAFELLSKTRVVDVGDATSIMRASTESRSSRGQRLNGLPVL